MTHSRLANPFPTIARFRARRLWLSYRHLNGEQLLGAASYFDAQVEFAERLVIENVISAQQYGATVVTYATVENLIIENGTVVALNSDGTHRRNRNCSRRNGTQRGWSCGR
jgi:glycerol-3-phosphate dehydrogenase